MKKHKRKTYIKLFNIPDIARQAMVMFSSNPPMSYTAIAERLGCDRSSVIHFHKRKIKEGITLQNFNGVKIELIGGNPSQQIEIINTGKDYKSYLRQYKKESSKLQSKNMKEAKKTVDKIKKGRINYDISFDFEIW